MPSLDCDFIFSLLASMAFSLISSYGFFAALSNFFLGKSPVLLEPSVSGRMSASITSLLATPPI